jgi:tetratricopeptide (TPR) repeat protein
MARATLAVALCALFLAPASASAAKKKKPKADPAQTEPAQTATDDVARYLDAAQAFYEKLDYERALDQAKRAEQFSHTPDDDVKIALIEGIMLASLARDEDADAAFRKGLALKPDAKLPYEVSPKIQQKFESVRTEVTKVVGERNLPEVSTSLTQDRPAVDTNAEVSASAGGSLKPAAWVTGGAGLTMVAAGTVCWFVAMGRYNSLTGGGITPAQALQYKNDGPTYQTAGWLLVVGGLAAVGTSAILFGINSSREDVEASILVTPSGASVGLAGTFP